jgi:hypothetical protein
MSGTRVANVGSAYYFLLTMDLLEVRLLWQHATKRSHQSWSPPKLLNLKQLKNSECWSMFVRHAFHGKNASEYPNLFALFSKVGWFSTIGIVSCGRFAFSKVEKGRDHTHPSVLTFLNFLLLKCHKIESFMLHTSLYINCIIFHHISLVFDNNIIVVFYPQIHLHCKYLLDFGLIITCYQADILPWDQTRNIFYPIWRYIILLLSSWNSIMNSCIEDVFDVGHVLTPNTTLTCVNILKLLSGR